MHVDRDARQVDRLGVVGRQPQRVRRDRRDRAGEADDGADAGERRPSASTASSAASMSRRAAADLVGASAGRRAGAARSSARSRRRPSAPRSTSAVPRTSSVEPPPMSTTRYGAGHAGRRRSPVAPANDSAASSSPVDDLGLDAEVADASRTPATNSSRVARRRGRPRSRRSAPARRPSARHCSAYSSRRRERARQRLGRDDRRCGRRPAPSRTISIRRTTSTSAPVGVDVGDEQPDRVGAAVDRGDPGRAVTPAARLAVGARRTRPVAHQSGRAARAPRRRAG